MDPCVSKCFTNFVVILQRFLLPNLKETNIQFSRSQQPLIRFARNRVPWWDVLSWPGCQCQDTPVLLLQCGIDPREPQELDPNDGAFNHFDKVQKIKSQSGHPCLCASSSASMRLYMSIHIRHLLTKGKSEMFLIVSSSMEMEHVMTCQRHILNLYTTGSSQISAFQVSSYHLGSYHQTFENTMS